MSGQGSGSGGQRRSDRLAKGKAVAYAPESSPDTDDEYDAIEGPRTRADSVIARNLQEHFDAEATGIAAREVRPPLGPGITIGGSARSSGASRRSSRTPTGAPPTRPSSKRQRADRVPPSANPIPEDFIMPGLRYPPQGGIRPRYHVTTLVVDTPLMTNLINHPSSLVRRCEVSMCFCMSLLLCAFHDLFVLTLFSLIPRRILVSRAPVEAGGLTSASSWVMLARSTASF
jgi:hypothetical protein